MSSNRNISITLSSEANKTSVAMYDIKSIKTSVLNFVDECEIKGFQRTKQWLTELNDSLNVDVKIPTPKFKIEKEDFETFIMAYSYFKVKEYARCAHFLKDIKTPNGIFLFHHALYKALDSSKPIDFTDMTTSTRWDYYIGLEKLDQKLQSFLSLIPNDGFSYYLRGLIYLKLQNKSLAIEMFCKAVNLLPLFWEGWDELSKLISNKTQLLKLKLPCSWVKEFFFIQMYIKLQKYEEAHQLLDELHNNGFDQTSFVTSGFATVYYNKRDFGKALKLFNKLEEDPYRLEDLDTYSNLLYVSDMRRELSYLAHRIFKVNKYSLQSCGIVGNYYSMRGEHAKAAEFFRRAVKLNPSYISCLILRGHEFMELKNTRSALLSYREAIAVNPQDYRAWYGMGQTYEILMMTFHSLFYYKKAHLIKPDDSRMLTALGEIYEKLNDPDNALRCYKRARNVGDVDSVALVHLARLYSEMKLEEEAVKEFQQLITETDKVTYAKEHSEAYRYLGNYCLKKQQYSTAFQFARLCLTFEGTKEDGKALMKELASMKDFSEEGDLLHLYKNNDSLPIIYIS